MEPDHLTENQLIGFCCAIAFWSGLFSGLLLAYLIVG